jgi:hypothetical protein
MNAFSATSLLSEEQKIEFVRRLDNALNPRQRGGKFQWNCSHKLVHARSILDQMGLSVGQVDTLLRFLRKHGGYCDCEIMFNVICATD